MAFLFLVHPTDRINDEEKPEGFTRYHVKTVNVSMLEKQEGDWEYQ